MEKESKATRKLSSDGKNFLILGAVALLGFLVLLFGFFMDNPGLPLGWLLGSVIEIFSYFTITRGSSFLLSSGDPKKAALGALFGVFRMFLYAGGMVLGGFCTYIWGTLAHSYCNLWTVFCAYLPMGFVLICTTFFGKTKEEEIVQKEETHE